MPEIKVKVESLKLNSGKADFQEFSYRIDSLYEHSQLFYKFDDHVAYTIYAYDRNISYKFTQIPFKFSGIKDADEAEKKDCFSYLEKDIAKFLANPISFIDEVDFQEPTAILIYIIPSTILVKLPDGNIFIPETQDDFFELRGDLDSNNGTIAIYPYIG